MSSPKHINNGRCPRCQAIFDRYPHHHPALYNWFLDVQKAHPEAHVAWAGRGKEDQEGFYKLKTSRAHYGQSAHNWNAAIDIFKLEYPAGAVWPKTWYTETVGPLVAQRPDFVWYGVPGSAFPELPHIEVRKWKEDARSGLLKLVDGAAMYPIPT
jgi:hypothetical protein